MFGKITIRRLHVSALTLVLFVSGVSAQTAQTPKKSVSSESKPAAPQVVTIVHRLNGLKMFRMLLRSEGQVEAISGLDEAFNIMDDVHTNIIAGLELEDGKTVVAWLPEADLEFGPRVFSVTPPQTLRSKQNSVSAQRTTVPKWPSTFAFRGGMFGAPDLTVIGPNGKRFDAEYVGLDGATGLSVLRLAEEALTLSLDMTDEMINVGDDVRVYGPEPAAKTRSVGRSMLVRMGATDVKVLTVYGSQGRDDLKV